MVNQILKDRGVQLVSNLLPVPFGGHQIGIPQDREMAGNRGPARFESPGNGPRRERSVAKQPKDLPARFIPECPEWLIEGAHGVVHPCIISKITN